MYALVTIRSENVDLSDTSMVLVRQTCTTFGDWTFDVAGPQLGNNLPPDFR